MSIHKWCSGHSVFRIENGTIYEVNKKGVETVTHFTEIK